VGNCRSTHWDVQQGHHLVKLAFTFTTWVLDFIVGEEGQNGGQCSFLCKKMHHPPRQ